MIIMGDEYVDYTLLQKMGLLKLKEEKFKSGLKVEDGFVDLTGFKNNMVNEQSNSTNTTSTSSTNTSNFGFLGDMASIGNNNNTTNANNDNLANESGSVNNRGELATLRVKLDDFEYKLERFIERINKIEEKLNDKG